MVYLIIILILIIFLLLTYLFFMKKELKQVSKEMKEIMNCDSNTLIHNKYGIKEIELLTNQINFLISYIKKIEKEYVIKNNALMKMITNISHDLRTPLTSAIGYIDIIQNSNLSKEEQEIEFKTIEERLRKLEELINSFFEFSTIVSSNEPTVLEKINLNSVLENCIANYYEDFEKENRKINLTSYSNKIILNSNKKLLTRIFDNLIGNSYKHSTSDLEINIKENNGIEIIFENNLLDSSLDTDKMFDEFYTLDISRTKGNTGLGLAIVKDFTEELNGRIFANKTDNKLQIIIIF